MKRVHLLENDDGTVRVYGGWVEVSGYRYRLDYQVEPGEAVQDIPFAELLDAARAGRVLILDDAGLFTWAPTPGQG